MSDAHMLQASHLSVCPGDGATGKHVLYRGLRFRLQIRCRGQRHRTCMHGRTAAGTSLPFAAVARASSCLSFAAARPR